MCDDHGGPAVKKLFEALVEEFLGADVDVARRFIKDDHFWF